MPNFIPSSFTDHVERLFHGSQATLRELITDAPLEGSNRCLLEKSSFLFGDQVTIPDESLYVYEHKWFRKVEGIQMFLPKMARSYPLAYLQKLSVACTMN